MLTTAKRNLINQCLKLSREYPNRVFYGFIDKDGKTFERSEISCVKAAISEGNKVYCKTKNGELIL